MKVSILGMDFCLPNFFQWDFGSEIVNIGVHLTRGCDLCTGEHGRLCLFMFLPRVYMIHQDGMKIVYFSKYESYFAGQSPLQPPASNVSCRKVIYACILPLPAKKNELQKRRLLNSPQNETRSRFLPSHTEFSAQLCAST